MEMREKKKELSTNLACNACILPNSFIILIFMLANIHFDIVYYID